MTRRFSRLANHFGRKRLVLETLEHRDLPAFVTPPVYPAGTNPTDMVAHDFNGDGLQDIAITNQTTPGKVSVLLNTGGGVFGAATSFPTGGSSPNSIAAGDVNGDGRTDLVVTNLDSGTVAILRGSGTGLFRRPVTYAAGTTPWDIAVTDLNSDGALDLAVVNRNASGTVSVLINSGAGTFAPAASYAAGDSPRSIVAADFDGDGFNDVAVANSGDDTLGVLLGRGDGTLKPMAAYEMGDNPYGVAAGDLNGDGKPDLVTAHRTVLGAVTVRLGTGDGTFAAAAGYYYTGDNAIAVRIADVTGDGNLDVITANQSGTTVSIHSGNGDGTLDMPMQLIAEMEAAGLAVADFDADAQLDVAVSDAAGSGVAIMLTGGGAFPATVAYSVHKGTSGIATGDLNGDGNSDMVVTSVSEKTVSLHFGDGVGGFQAPVDIPIGGYVFDPVVDDFDGDGNLDIATHMGAHNDVAVLLGNGDGTFQPPVMYDVLNNATGLASADLNNDGDVDLVVALHSYFAVLLGNGDGTFEPADVISHTFVDDDIVVADFNEDGNLDVAAKNSSTSNRVEVVLGNGDGSFQPSLFISTQGGVQKVAVGDFNGDSQIDIASANDAGSGNGTVSVLLGNGNGTFQPFINYPMGGVYVLGFRATDFDGDGVLDLAVGEIDTSAENTIIVLLGDGDGGFGPPLSYTAAPGTGNFLAAADFTGDGLPDLAASGNLSIGQVNFGYVAVHLNAADWPPLPIGDGPRPSAPLDVDTAETLLPTATQTQTSRRSTIRPVDDDATAIAIRPKHASRHLARVVDAGPNNAESDLLSTEIA